MKSAMVVCSSNLSRPKNAAPAKPCCEKLRVISRFSAFLTVFGIALNRLNTALITFNWNLYQEIPHWREVTIVLTVYATYIVVYRAVLARMPILYTWKDK